MPVTVGIMAEAGRKRPDFVLKLYRMLKECSELITWENGERLFSQCNLIWDKDQLSSGQACLSGGDGGKGPL